LNENNSFQPILTDCFYVKFHVPVNLFLRFSLSMAESSFYHEALCRLFTHPGEGNTEAVLEAVARRAEELSIGKILVATCSGETALKARKMLKPHIHLIAVSHVTGFAAPDVQEMPEQKRREEFSNHGE
jgi:hypothetical protein